MLWYGMVWYGMVWYGMLAASAAEWLGIKLSGDPNVSSDSC